MVKIPSLTEKEEQPISTLTLEAPLKGEDHSFSETACGLGKALGKLTLTPVVGVGLMGFAAGDAIASGVVGTKIKASKLLYKATKSDKGILEGDSATSAGSVATSVGSIDETIKSLGLDDRVCDLGTHPALRAEPTPIEIFDPETCDYKYLRKEYLDKGVPFILQRTDGKPISNASPPRTTTDDDSPEGCISVQADNMNVKLDGIDPIVKKLLPLTFRAHWPLWFQGNYKSGLAHVDLGPGTCNFYWLKRGKKDVIIAPFEVTRKLTLSTGIDNIHIPGSADNHDYLKDLDMYYRVTLEEQSLLIFNNSGCLHHFTNIIEEGVTPIALSNRCKHAYGSDPRGWVNLAGNLKIWYSMASHFAGLASSGEETRKAEKI